MNSKKKRRKEGREKEKEERKNENLREPSQAKMLHNLSNNEGDKESIKYKNA